ncbi:small ribosomal subunit protein eS7x isoform X2 [Euphorbia lathyris]|uniref:small ribosomal subunit protein eS7x isoform X2 n=1 Tax=Euphorbia lathyris TaxID=212925 RepID=UPI00331413D5
MYSTWNKIKKDKDAEPTEFEESVAQAIFDLENTNQELKSDLKDLFINSAVQMDVSGNRKAVVIYVPYRLRKAYRKIHLRLVRELEKKFSGKACYRLLTTNSSLVLRKRRGEIHVLLNWKPKINHDSQNEHFDSRVESQFDNYAAIFSLDVIIMHD